MHLGDPVGPPALTAAVNGFGDSLGAILDPDHHSLKAFPATENYGDDTFSVLASLRSKHLYHLSHAAACRGDFAATYDSRADLAL